MAKVNLDAKSTTKNKAQDAMSMMKKKKKTVSLAGMLGQAAGRVSKPVTKQEKVGKKKTQKPPPHGLAVLFNEQTAEYEENALASIPARLDTLFQELSEAMDKSHLDEDTGSPLQRLKDLEASVEEASLPLSKQTFTVRYKHHGQEETTLGQTMDELEQMFAQGKETLGELWMDWAEVQGQIDQICRELTECESKAGVDEDLAAIRALRQEVEAAALESSRDVDDSVTYCNQQEKKFADLWNQMLKAFDNE